MLVNLSNHPFSKWSELQSNLAIETFRQVKDIPFPHINPNHSRAEVEELVTQYIEKILALRPMAVHVMGEFTFTFLLVTELKKLNIPAIVSTTERIVSETDGKKVVTFNFVRFRHYF